MVLWMAAGIVAFPGFDQPMHVPGNLSTRFLWRTVPKDKKTSG
jgi:hypothetical protein